MQEKKLKKHNLSIFLPHRSENLFATSDPNHWIFDSGDWIGISRVRPSMSTFTFQRCWVIDSSAELVSARTSKAFGASM